MSWLRVRNWDKWQSYRSDRGQPPWIKVHRALMRDANWVELTDAERGQLVAMWMLAADRSGVIPASPTTIRKFCFMEHAPNLQRFIDLGFIEPDAIMTPEWRQPDANVASQTSTDDANQLKNNMASARRQGDVNMTHQSRVEENRDRVEERAADAAAPAGENFAFRGKFVERITEGDLTCWLKAYPTLPREAMLAELARCDDYYSRGFKGKLPSNFFFAASNWLDRTHKRALEDKAKAPVMVGGRVLSDIEIEAYRGAR